MHHSPVSYSVTIVVLTVVEWCVVQNWAETEAEYQQVQVERQELI